MVEAAESGLLSKHRLNPREPVLLVQRKGLRSAKLLGNRRQTKFRKVNSKLGRTYMLQCSKNTWYLQTLRAIFSYENMKVQKYCLFKSIKRRWTFVRFIVDARHERRGLFGILLTNDQQIVSAVLIRYSENLHSSLAAEEPDLHNFIF